MYLDWKLSDLFRKKIIFLIEMLDLKLNNWLRQSDICETPPPESQMQLQECGLSFSCIICEIYRNETKHKLPVPIALPKTLMSMLSVFVFLQGRQQYI